MNLSGKVFRHRQIGAMTLLDVGRVYPNLMLTVSCKFISNDFFKDINGKTITVTGDVVEYVGKPEIIIIDPEMLAVWKQSKLGISANGK